MLNIENYIYATCFLGDAEKGRHGLFQGRLINQGDYGSE